MEHTLTAADHAGAYQIGTPHVLSTAPLIGSLEILKRLVQSVYVKKSLHITRFMLNLIAHELSDFGFTIGNPLEDENEAGIFIQSMQKQRAYVKR